MESFAKIYCNTCMRPTNHSVEKKVLQHDVEGDPGESMQLLCTHEFSILQCMGCDAISFRQLEEYPRFLDVDGFVRRGALSSKRTFERFFPPRKNDSFEITAIRGLPDDLLIPLQETLECYNSDSRILCTAGLRLVTEILIDQVLLIKSEIKADPEDPEKPNNLNLFGKLNLLLEDKKYASIHDALQEFRKLGNAALHNAARPSRKELRLGLDLLVQVLNQVFSMPEDVEKLRSQRINRETNK